MKSEPHRRKGIRIMGGLIGLVKPLLPVMFLAVLLGTLGYLCAIFLTILAGYGLLQLFFEAGQPGTLFAALGILAVLRGLSTMENSTAITSSPSSFWRSYATRCSRRCGSSALRSWKEETREI